MKKLLAFLLTMTMLFSLAGCAFIEKEDDFDVDEYIDEAEELIDEGDLEGAEKILKRALRKAEDEDDVEELEECLEILQAMMDEEPKAETSHQTTAPTETTKPTEQPAGQEASRNLLDSFNSDDMYRINIFLSNFSEQGFQVYPCSDYRMLMFGYKYAKINNREVLNSNSTHYYISQSNMDSILNRFFGRSVSLTYGEVLNEDNYPVTYQDSTYYFPGADGESVSYCTVATKMVDNGNGTYTVNFDVYGHVNPHESMSGYYSYTSAQARNASDLEYQYSGEAVVYDYIHSGNIETKIRTTRKL